MTIVSIRERRPNAVARTAQSPGVCRGGVKGTRSRYNGRSNARMAVAFKSFVPKLCRQTRRRILIGKVALQTTRKSSTASNVVAADVFVLSAPPPRAVRLGRPDWCPRKAERSAREIRAIRDNQ